MHCGMSGDNWAHLFPDRSTPSGDIQRKIDVEVTRILKEAQTQVTKLFKDKMNDLRTLADSLVEKERLTSDEINGVTECKDSVIAVNS